VKRSFIVREEAKRDIVASAEWYEQQNGLGADFFKKVEARLSGIAHHDEYIVAPYRRFPTFVVRREFVERFPYRVFFVETDDVREVIAVLRDGQDEERWKKRL
jgi:hypothetical protein